MNIGGLSGWGPWAFALVAAFCTGLSKSGLPGFGLVTVVLMARLFPPRESTGIVLPLLILADIGAVALYRKHASAREVLPPLLPAFLGILAGVWLMPRIRPETFGPLIGGIVLAMVGLQLLRLRAPAILDRLPHSPLFVWAMGVASGIATMLANAAGPIMSIYLLARGLPKWHFLGTFSVFFLLINLIKVPFSAGLGLIHGGSLLLNLALAPAVILGMLSGKRLVAVLPQIPFELLLLVFAAAAALHLILR